MSARKHGTNPQHAARRMLASHVGPAIVYGGHDDEGCYLVWTDTTPGLDLIISEDGGISTPYFSALHSDRRMKEAMADDEKRVLRIVQDMMEVAAAERRVWARFSLADHSNGLEIV